jgi:hypothetical protein
MKLVAAQHVGRFSLYTHRGDARRRVAVCLSATRTGSRLTTDDNEGGVMATGETGFDDVTFDLVSVQYHSLKAGHDYGQYVRDAKNAGLDDIASFFEEVMTQDSERAQKCHDFLKKTTETSQSGSSVN